MSQLVVLWSTTVARHNRRSSAAVRHLLTGLADHIVVVLEISIKRFVPISGMVQHKEVNPRYYSVVLRALHMCYHTYLRDRSPNLTGLQPAPSLKLRR